MPTAAVASSHLLAKPARGGTPMSPREATAKVPNTTGMSTPHPSTSGTKSRWSL